MKHVSPASRAVDESDVHRDRAPRRPVEFPGHLVLAGEILLDVRLVDLSYDGCQIEVPRQLSVGEHVQLSVGGRGKIPATVRWFRAGRAGLKFAEQEQPNELLKRKGPRRGEGMAAQVRRLGRLTYSVQLRDLSPDGCQTEVVERPGLDEVMQVKLPGLETISARVRWVDNYVAGLKFERPIHPAVFELLLERAGTQDLPALPECGRSS